MENPQRQPPRLPASRPGRPPILRCIAIVLLVLIILVGLAVLIIWLAVKPKRLNYSVESASVQHFDLADNKLNASFSFEVRAHNPNTRVSLYYDSIAVTLGFGDQDLAFGVLNPFFQHHEDVTRLDVNLAAENVPLHESAMKDIALEKAAGEIDLDLWIKARIRFKVGIWKTSHRTLRIRCSPVVVYFSKAKSFQTTTCLAEV